MLGTIRERIRYVPSGAHTWSVEFGLLAWSRGSLGPDFEYGDVCYWMGDHKGLDTHLKQMILTLQSPDLTQSLLSDIIRHI